MNSRASLGSPPDPPSCVVQASINRETSRAHAHVSTIQCDAIQKEENRKGIEQSSSADSLAWNQNANEGPDTAKTHRGDMGSKPAGNQKEQRRDSGPSAPEFVFSYAMACLQAACAK